MFFKFMTTIFLFFMKGNPANNHKVEQTKEQREDWDKSVRLF